MINQQVDNCDRPDSFLTKKIRHMATLCGVLILVLCCIAGAVWGLDLPLESAKASAAVLNGQEPVQEEVAFVPETTEASSEKDIMSLPLLADISGVTEDANNGAPETSSVREYVKIGLKYSSSAVASVDVVCSDGFLLVSASGRSYSTLSDMTAYTALHVVNENDSVVVYDENGAVVLGSLGAGECLMSAAENFDSRMISIDGKQYRDGFMALPYNGKLTVINYVDMEHYLWGVINHEMTYNNPAEALKAQAVASRSFAVVHYNYHSNYGFDLCTTSNCQAYEGVSGEKTQTVQACRETSGIIMVSEGKAAGGYYFASSGGYTLNSENVWVSKVSYLRSVRDDYAPLNFWNTSITFEKLQSRLSSSGKSVGTISSVAVTARLDNGAVSTLAVTGSDGSVTLKGSELSTVFGSSVVRSRFFSMGSQPEPGVDQEVIRTSEPYRYVSGEEVKSFVVLKGANKELTVDVLDNRYLITADVTVPIYSTGSLTNEYNKLTFSDETVTDGTIYFTGLGYGHGVGMPQLSAIAMAKAGKTYDEILKYYYTGISLQTLDTI